MLRRWIYLSQRQFGLSLVLNWFNELAYRMFLSIPCSISTCPKIKTDFKATSMETSCDWWFVAISVALRYLPSREIVMNILMAWSTQFLQIGACPLKKCSSKKFTLNLSYSTHVLFYLDCWYFSHCYYGTDKLSSLRTNSQFHWQVAVPVWISGGAR